MSCTNYASSSDVTLVFSSFSFLSFLVLADRSSSFLAYFLFSTFPCLSAEMGGKGDLF